MLRNGEQPTPDELVALALHGYGNFTSFLVTDRGVQGWSMHLARLSRDSEYLFGSPVSEDLVRKLVRDYLAGRQRPFTLRVTVFNRELSLATPEAAQATDVLVTSRATPQRPPGDIATSRRLRTIALMRDLPMVKHVGLLPQLHARRSARLAGADDALFVDTMGQISEGTTWNLGLFDGTTITWPAGPQLDGITKQLLSQSIIDMGLKVDHRPVSTVELSSFPVAFACNASAGVIPIAAIDGHVFDTSPKAFGDLIAAYDSIALDPI